MRTSVYLSLGSNLGDRFATLKTSLILINELPATSVLDLSKVYNTEPAVDNPGEHPVYANMVVHIKTELSPHELLRHLAMIETDLGRVRTTPNSPRTIDIDILLYGNREINEERLVIPHPRLLERDFVVTPLLEIAPHAVMPDGAPITRDAVKTGAVLDALGTIDFPR